MEVITGKPVSPEIVAGKLRFCLRSPHLLSAFSALSPETEARRFKQAQLETIRQLSEHYMRARPLVGESNASIFNIYAMMVEDREYQQTVLDFIRNHGLTAEYSVLLAGENYAAVFSAMDDEYMRARAADIRNVANQLINTLLDRVEEDDLGTEPVILVGDEFSPGRILFLDRKLLLGVVARRGNPNSHAACLARALGVPAIVQTNIAPVWDGHMAVLDGEQGVLYMDPTQEVLERAKKSADSEEEPAV